MSYFYFIYIYIYINFFYYETLLLSFLFILCFSNKKNPPTPLLSVVKVVFTLPTPNDRTLKEKKEKKKKKSFGGLKEEMEQGGGICVWVCFFCFWKGGGGKGSL